MLAAKVFQRKKTCLETCAKIRIYSRSPPTIGSPSFPVRIAISDNGPTVRTFLKSSCSLRNNLSPPLMSYTDPQRDLPSSSQNPPLIPLLSRIAKGEGNSLCLSKGGWRSFFGGAFLGTSLLTRPSLLLLDMSVCCFVFSSQRRSLLRKFVAFAPLTPL